VAFTTALSPPEKTSSLTPKTCSRWIIFPPADYEALDAAKVILEKDHRPDGYNIGIIAARRRARPSSTSTFT
jgi:hypothetical protein